jgi:hypothetical protein
VRFQLVRANLISSLRLFHAEFGDPEAPLLLMVHVRAV